MNEIRIFKLFSQKKRKNKLFSELFPKQTEGDGIATLFMEKF